MNYADEVAETPELLRQNTLEMKTTLDKYSSSMFDEAMDKAAVKIQSNIRGYLTRKSLKISSKSVEAEAVREEDEKEEVAKTEEVKEVTETEKVKEVTETEKVKEVTETGKVKEVTETGEIVGVTETEEVKEVTVSEEVKEVSQVVSQSEPVNEIEMVLEDVEQMKSKGSKKKRNRKKSPKQDEIERAIEQVLSLAVSSQPDSTCPASTLPSDQEQQAATKIQATFKGYKVRRDFKEQRK